MIVIGCDTGLANFGAAKCEVNHESKTIRLLALDLFHTQAVKHTVTIGKRGGITKERDTAGSNFQRIIDLHVWFCNFVLSSQEHCPVHCCFESMSTGESVGAPASLLMGAAFGVLATWVEANEVATTMHTPQQIKIALGVGRSADKDAVHDALLARFPNLDDVLLDSFRHNEFFGYDENSTDKRMKQCYSSHERSHPCDALAAIVATWPSYEVTNG